MTRKEKILRHIDIASSRGIEIAPLVNPVIEKSDGDVYYVDHATTDELKQKFRDDKNINTEMICHVDYVWGEQTLSEAVGSSGLFDYCVSSHVIEHVPDLVSWLREISEILTDEGIASFAIPDKRYTFDARRRITSISDVVGAYVRKLRRPSGFNIYDHLNNFINVPVSDAWDPAFDASQVPKVYSRDVALTAAIELENADTYNDCHCWVFTPRSFLSLMAEMGEHGLLDFEVIDFYGTEHNTLEFFAALRKISPTLSPEQKRELSAASARKWLSGLPVEEDRETIALRSDLDATKAHLEQAMSDLGRTKSDFERTKDDFEQAKADFERVKSEGDKAVRQLKDDLRQTELENKQLALQVAALRESTSWRVTAPLRWVVERFRGMR